MNKVLNVRPKCSGILEVELADGRRGEFDVRPFMVSDFFRELQDEAYFNQVRIFFGGVGWPNGQDLGPDTISEELRASEDLAA